MRWPRCCAGNWCLAHIVDPIFGAGRFGVSDRFAALWENCENLFSAAAIGAVCVSDVCNYVFLLGYFKHRFGRGDRDYGYQSCVNNLGRCFVLGERIGIRRVLGIIGALIGAMIVIQPEARCFPFMPYSRWGLRFVIRAITSLRGLWARAKIPGLPCFIRPFLGQSCSAQLFHFIGNR